MSTLLDTLKQQGFNSTPAPIEESTVERTKESFGEADFENTTGLPAKMMNMTMFELVKRYGGELQLKGWADILNKLMTAMEKDQRSQERRNVLIEKDFVLSNVFKYVDLLMDSIIDLADSQNELIIASVLSDVDNARKEIPLMRKAAYTKSSKNAKKSMKDSLKRLRNKYDDDEE